MTKHKLIERLDNFSLPLLADGAMGTMLHSRGVAFGTCFDALNINNPALVAEIHRDYIDAGAQIVLTNTFGANRYKLAAYGLEERLADINRAGVDLARKVVLASFKSVLLAGDVGPLGVRLVPFGQVKLAQAREAFAEQIALLAEAGVDLIVMETMTDLYELLEALKAARQVCDLPVVASMTFTRDDRTLLGDSPEKVSRALQDAGADIIGINCSGGPVQLLRLLRQMRAAVPEARLWVKPNAGWPERVAGRIMYPATPAYFGEYIWAFQAAGAKVIGGCCGTTPAHIAAMQAALLAGPPEEPLPLEDSLPAAAALAEPTPDQPSALAQKLAAGKFVICAEMDPPRGLNLHKLLAGGSLLAEAGADVINVADNPMARMRMSPWAVCHLIQNDVGIESTLHFPTRGRNLLRVQGDLLAAHALGVRNVFVVKGDPTAIGEYPDAMDDYDLVPAGLIRLIKQGFNHGVDYAGSDIGQPTAFFVGSALNLTPKDPARQMESLQEKLAAGVDFLITQPVYDPPAARVFLDQYEAQHGPLPVPILLGVLPLYGVRHARFLHNEVPGITLTPQIFERMEAAGKGAKREGVRIAVELVEQIRSWANGIYITPAFGRYDLVAAVVEACRQDAG